MRLSGTGILSHVIVNREVAGVLILFSVLSAILFTFESWAFGPYSWMYGYGAGLETLPAHLAFAQDGRNFADWAPFIASGADRLSFWGNADPLSIERALVFLFPTWLANGGHRFLQYFIAVYFTARVCKEQLGLDHRWALLAGYLHGCFAYFTFGEMLAFPGVPMLVWLLDRLRSSKQGPTLALPAGLLFSLLTTFTHSDPYLAVFSLGWILIVWRDFSPRTFLIYLLFFLSLCVGDCQQLFAAAANASLSFRSNMPPETVAWTLDGLFYRQLQFDFFNQDPLMKAITINLPGIVLLQGVVLAIVLRRIPERRAAANVFLCVAGLFVLLSQRWLFVGAQNLIGAVLPWVRGVYMGRFYTLPATFLISSLFALGLHLSWPYLSRIRVVRYTALSVVAGFLLFMTFWPKVALFPILGIDGWGEKNFQVAAIETIKRKNGDLFRVASVLPLQPSYAYAQGLETADGWVNLYPGVYRDVWLRILQPLFKEVPRTKDIFDPDNGKPQDNYIFLGADLAHPDFGLLPGENPLEAMRTGFDIDRRFNLPLLGLQNVRYLLSELPLKSKNIALVHRPAISVMWPQSRDWATGKINGVRPLTQVELTQGRLERVLRNYKDSLEAKAKGKDIYIYELKTEQPRFRFVESLLVEPTGKAVLDRLAAVNSQELAATAVIEQRDAITLEGKSQFGTGHISIVAYSPDEIQLEIESAEAGLIVFASTFSPYWQAEVNGRRRALMRINHSQMALRVEPGETTVRLEYLPPYSMTGIWRRLTRHP